MLLTLSIANFALIEKVSISFHAGLNVITGETGSGKSVILGALNFIQGARQDTAMIRHGSEKTVCEATFEVEENSPLLQLLQEAGIDYDINEPLIIKRELQLNGKGRVTINNQSANLALLKKITPFLIEFSGQHAHLALLDTHAPQRILDSFANLIDLQKEFSRLYQDEQELKKRIQTIENSQSERLRKIDICKLEIEEIKQANLQEGQEELLFQEFERLSHQDEIKQKTNELLYLFEDVKPSIISLLNRSKNTLERLVQMDAHFTETHKALSSSIVEIQEVAYEIRRYQERLHFSPERLQTIEQKLKQIAHLKRKYGQNIPEIQHYLELQIQKLQELENQDLLLEELKSRHEAHLHKTSALAHKLSCERKKAASALEEEITREISSLNMPKALFEVEITNKERSETGDDLIEFFLTPNVGEKRIDVKEASGGELARVALATKLILADRLESHTLIFDEIDANIGGKTASLVGEKLASLGKTVQVISITHFPQVARFSSSHFCIQKKEKEGRTHSIVEYLETQSQREQEIERMLGGKLETTTCAPLFL
jgi:DNA repair protein RecN (Recombination protein N)